MTDDLVKRARDKWAHSEELCYELADHIDTLEDSCNYFSKQSAKLIIENQRFSDRIEKLEAALKPFADLAYESDGEMYERLAHNLEDGSFIRARKALEGKDG